MLWCRCAIEYRDKYSKASRSFWQYYRDDPNDNVVESGSFIFKIYITGKTTAAVNTLAVPLKQLSNFWRTLETSLINCETNIILTWSADCVISSATGETEFSMTDTKLT